MMVFMVSQKKYQLGQDSKKYRRDGTKQLSTQTKDVETYRKSDGGASETVVACRQVWTK